MKIARSGRQLVLGIIALILLFMAASNIVTDRCSLALSDVDMTWEEYVAQKER